jgi:diaphanous 1
MLARMKLDLPAIRQAILEIDDTKLSSDELKSIGKQLPTSEEVGRQNYFANHC